MRVRKQHPASHTSKYAYLNDDETCAAVVGSLKIDSALIVGNVKTLDSCSLLNDCGGCMHDAEGKQRRDYG